MTMDEENTTINLKAENLSLKKTIERLRQQEAAQQELLAFVSHEIKTPIGAISAMAELLKSTNLDETQTHYVNTLFFAADNLTLATQDMLDFASLDAGHLNFKPQDIQLGKFLSTLALSIAPQAEAKGLSFSAQMASNVPQIITVDANRLSQVINNLANNALKYTNQGSISLKVWSKALETGEDEIYVQVNDTGIGISQEEQEKIFKPFVQASNAIDKSIMGSGLGLWIARKIVAGLNGNLTCTSKENEGSSFTLSFVCKQQGAVLEKPISANEVSQEEAPKESAPQNTILEQTTLQDKAVNSPVEKQQATRQIIEPTKKEEFQNQLVTNDQPPNQFPLLEGRILVVEDNHLNQMLVEVYLEKFGLTVKCVDNGLSAIGIVDDEEFDLILMDMMMPILDGPETSIELHRSWEEKNQKKVPIIAFSAITNLENKTSYLEAGMDGFVAKPINSEVFYNVLKQHLPLKKAPARLTQKAATA